MLYGLVSTLAGRAGLGRIYSLWRDSPGWVHVVWPELEIGQRGVSGTGFASESPCCVSSLCDLFPRHKKGCLDLSECVCVCVCVCLCVCVSVCVWVSHSVVFNSLWSPWTVDHQAPLSLGFPRQDYWVGCYFLLQEIIPTQDWTQISCIAGKFFTTWAIRETRNCLDSYSHPLTCVWEGEEWQGRWEAGIKKKKERLSYLKQFLEFWATLGLKASFSSLSSGFSGLSSGFSGLSFWEWLAVLKSWPW